MDPDFAREIFDHAFDESPRECCGLIAFDGLEPMKLYRCRNVHLSPESHFTLDPRDQMRALTEIAERGWWLGAVYHSHPNGLALLSESDRQTAKTLEPYVLHIIASLTGDEPELRAYYVNTDGDVLQAWSGKPVPVPA